MEVSKDEHSKLKDELPKEIHEIKRSWVPKYDKDKDKDKDKKGKGRCKKKGDGVNEVPAEKNSPTNDAR